MLTLMLSGAFLRRKPEPPIVGPRRRPAYCRQRIQRARARASGSSSSPPRAGAGRIVGTSTRMVSMDSIHGGRCLHWLLLSRPMLRTAPGRVQHRFRLLPYLQSMQASAPAAAASRARRKAIAARIESPACPRHLLPAASAIKSAITITSFRSHAERRVPVAGRGDRADRLARRRGAGRHHDRAHARPRPVRAGRARTHEQLPDEPHGAHQRDLLLVQWRRARVRRSRASSGSRRW